jgi:peroxiredoxin
VAAGEVVASRPLPAHVLLASRFAGNGAVALLGYLCVIVCSLLPSLIFAGRFASPLIVLHALARGVVPLLYVAALAYCAVTLARNALAAAVVAVYWLFVQLWGDFLARVFNFALTQNRLSYACLGLGIVLGTMAIRRRLERAAPPAAGRARLPGLALACVAFGLLNAWHTVARSHDKPLRQDPLALTMAGQHLDGGPRVPGFWLPDQHGRAYRISQAGGKVIVVAFWSPEVPDSIPILEVLQAATREFPSDQVTCIAIAVANDHAVARHVAAEAGYAFPMLTDTGTHLAGKVEQSGPLAEAYVVTGLPTLFVADRAHRLTAAISGAASPREQLLAEVGRALALRVPPL